MIVVMIKWVANPFRGDRFAEGWLPAAEAALDYGAVAWSFYRANDGRLDFLQTATFRTKAEWDLYWYSEEISEKRVEMAGYYQVPLLPSFHEILGEGVVKPELSSR
ncbi:MAG: hypothetical protein ACXWEE_03960 [Thermoleophilaceae bacterium]|jgi:hypothetical protein